MPLIQTFSLPAPSSASGRHFRLFSSIPQRPTSFPFPFSSPSQNLQDPHVQPFPFYNPSHNFNVPQFQPQQPTSDDDSDDDVIIGDCLVFEEGAFDQPIDPSLSSPKKPKKKKGRPLSEPDPQDLVPDKWREAVEEINLTKKEKRRIANQLRFGSKMEGRKPSNLPPLEQYKALREMKMKVDPEEYRAYREMKVAKVKPEELVRPEPQSRVVPKNPRLDINGGSLEDINDFFNSSNYINEDKDGDKKREARPKLFTLEEKVILNRRKPDLNIATTSKWMPLHAIAASGEFYLLDKLMIHINDINSVDKDGLTALHRAIIGKKQAIINYLLRNSANPFMRDNDGATLMHYSVQTASSDTIKILLLYNVDINIPDNDGWTPLHLAVQTQRTDIVKLLLIKGADRSLKNNDGLTPLELCLYLGHNVRTYELIKLLKGFNGTKTKV